MPGLCVELEVCKHLMSNITLHIAVHRTIEPLKS